MNEAGWRNLSIGLAVVLVVLLSAGGGLLVFGGRGGSGASPTLTATASATGSASASPTGTASESATTSPTATPKPTASPTKAPTPSPTQAISPTTSIAFDNLKLDARADPAGVQRSIAFTSNGPSDIVATIKVVASLLKATACLKPGSGSAFCQTGTGTINFKGKATGATGSWTLTLIGSTTDTPVVDLTLTWRTKAPKVTLTNFRFDGTGHSDYNGFTATVKARGGGNLTFAFSWGTSYPWDLLVQDQTGGTNTEPTGTGTSLSHSVAATKDHQYRSTLQNTAAGSGSAVRLNGSLAWP
jgi:hypothetical protein